MPPEAKLEESIQAELARLAGESPAQDDPTEDPIESPDETEENEEVEEVEQEAEGPGEEDEGEEDEEPSERAPAPAQKKKGRANERIQALSRRAQEAEAALARAEAQRVAAERQQRAAAQAEEDRRFQAEIAALPPEEQAPKRQEFFNRKVAQTVNGLQQQLADTQDQAAFNAASASDPVLRAIAPRVEQIAAQYRAQGNVVNRETIANYVLGQLARSPKGRELLMQRTPAKKVKRTPTSRGDSGRNSGSAPRTTSGEPTRAQLMARLKDKTI